MAKASEIISLIQNLTEEQLDRLKRFILTKLNIVVVATASIRTHDRPHCGSKHIIKFGKKGGKQRYTCKDCGKVFVESTGTIAYKSRYSFKVWSEYVTCMISGHTLRYSAEACGINYKTAFYWRHKILGSLKEVQDDGLKLKDIVEADETFFAISYKGNHKFSKIFKMPRKPHKRGEKSKKRGQSREKVCVSCMVDNHNGYQANIAGLGRIATVQLEALNKVEEGSMLVTDKAKAYVKYALGNHLDLIQLKAGKEYKRGIYSLAHINAFHSSIKKFTLNFNGVSTKHLPNYLNWRIWLTKTVEMIQSKRSADMLDESANHRYSITKEQIHAKNPIPVAA